MSDIAFKGAVIGLQGGGASYAAQDLEGQAIGNAVPFQFSFETGFVSFGYDFISDNPTLFNAFDSQDMEGLAIGVITKIPGTVIISASLIATPVLLLTGTFTQQIDYVSEDFESYAIGSFISANNVGSTGLGTVTAPAAGQPRTTP